MGEIIQLGNLKFVGFRVLCAGDQYIVEIPRASEQLSMRLGEIKNVLSPNLQFGVFVVDCRTDKEDGYWVCAKVSEFEEIPSDMVTLTIPAQTYAVYRHKGANTKIREAYDHLHSWIELNQYQRLTDKWHLEIFHSWTDPKHVDVELWDTVEKNESFS